MCVFFLWCMSSVFIFLFIMCFLNLVMLCDTSYTTCMLSLFGGLLNIFANVCLYKNVMFD